MVARNNILVSNKLITAFLLKLL